MNRSSRGRNMLYRARSRRAQNNARNNGSFHQVNDRSLRPVERTNCTNLKETRPVEVIVEELEEILKEDYSESIFETFLGLNDELLKILNEETKHGELFIELILKIIIKISKENKLNEEYRHFLTSFLQSNFATKGIDTLISRFLPSQGNMNMFLLLISFLKLTFEILPGLAFDLYYHRVANLNILLNIPYYKTNTNKEALLELEELEILSSLSDPNNNNPCKSNNKNQVQNADILPDNFRYKSILPSVEELLYTKSKNVFLRKNKAKGGYYSVDDYLDVQFRLMHEDFNQPLREGLKEYIEEPNKRNFNVRVYKNVQLLGTTLNRRLGIVQYIQLDKSRIKYIKWSQCKRLVYGSLLCISCDDFKTFLFATVANRDDKDIKKGILAIKFLNDIPLNEETYTILETMNMFESYKYVLEKLQCTYEKDLPMKDYLVYLKTEITLPRYVKENSKYESRLKIWVSNHIVKSDSNSSRSSNNDKVELNNSQWEAFQNALSNEITIIQGPPGTGKTYLGLQICSCFIKNLWNYFEAFGPILVVCYTNHALDQFLEGISTLTKNIVRVGGQSKSEILIPFSLHNHKINTKLSEYSHMKCALHNELEDLEEKLHTKNKMLKSFIQIEHVGVFMAPDHFDYLNDFGLENWLSGKSLSDESNFYKDLVEDLLEDILYAGIHESLEELIISILNSSSCNVAEEDSCDNDVKYLTDQRMLDVEYDDITSLTFRFNNVLSLSHGLYIQFKEKKFMLNERFLKGMLTNKSEMTEDEVKLVENLNELSLANRWRLYQYWRSSFVKILRRRIKCREIEYNHCSNRLNKVKLSEDQCIMQSKHIIGMTTTGAARYSRVLENIGCKIIIVEEAAEVLESHIIGALNSKCQHLILMGDHKQLRPSPAVYSLSTQYGLDLSLFERLVNNNLNCNTLTIQHRMHPNIANIIRFIYPDLKDAPHVTSYPSIPAIHTNLFFFNHSKNEKLNEDIVSYTNKFEAELIVKLCHHLIENGVARTGITILTLYSGQKFLIDSLMDKKYLSEVRVCVVDNYQGEENNIILLSLVRSNDEERIGFAGIDNRICVSLSRAKHGLYVFGNFDLLSNKSKLWKKICNYLYEKNSLGNSLNLFCQNHPSKTLIIRTSSDFDKYPDCGCEELCNGMLKCGHTCVRYCHFLDHDHEAYRCMEECTKLCPVGHKCLLKCYEDCKDCKVKVQKVSSKCGHVSDYECGDQNIICNLPCKVCLPCEHLCNGTCGTCHMSTLHVTCEDTCNSELVCGHTCKVKCSSFCNPCEEICQEKCLHNNCTYFCGSSCYMCKLRCEWKCKHKKCTALCNELCNREMCNEKCGALLICVNCTKNFQCYGICGEKCRKVCQICDPNIQEGKTYVTLWTCDHSFEVGFMDSYMLYSDNEQEVIRKKCPECHALIIQRSTFRYMNDLKRITAKVKHVQRIINKEIEQYDRNTYNNKMREVYYKIEKVFQDLQEDNYYIDDDKIHTLYTKYDLLTFPFNNIMAYKYVTSLTLFSKLLPYIYGEDARHLIKWLNPNIRKFDLSEIKVFFKEKERIDGLYAYRSVALLITYSSMYNDKCIDINKERYFYFKNVRWSVCLKNHVSYNQNSSSDQCLTCLKI